MEDTGTNNPNEYDRFRIEALVNERVETQMYAERKQMRQEFRRQTPRATRFAGFEGVNPIQPTDNDVKESFRDFARVLASEISNNSIKGSDLTNLANSLKNDARNKKNDLKRVGAKLLKQAKNSDIKKMKAPSEPVTRRKNLDHFAQEFINICELVPETRTCVRRLPKLLANNQ